MALQRDAFCSSCGTAYPPPLVYPRQCPACGQQVWANPVPVSVVLVPILDGAREGLLVIRRGIEPGMGRLALAGGFLEAHETWQQGGAREVLEETGLRLDPSQLAPLWFTSTSPSPNQVLLFSVAAPLTRAALPPFTATAETSARGLVFGPSGLEALFAFPLHVEAARRFFSGRGLTGAHGYQPA